VPSSVRPARHARRSLLAALAALAALTPSLGVGCRCVGRHEPGVTSAAASVAIATAPSPPASSVPSSAQRLDGGGAMPSSSAPTALAAGALGDAATSERPLHFDTQDGLLSLFSTRPFSATEIERRGDPQLFLRKTFGPEGPSKINQGNKALARHAIGRAQCLAALAGVTLQSEEQKRRCGGAERMVPIYGGGDPSKATACIDVFEFPNQPCELPFVWVSPVQAQVLCEMQGKRLCAQEEWTLACRGDPEGKADWLYAYGNELDLTACNTNERRNALPGPVCDPRSATSAWGACGTDTEPSGAFPKCRSRFGVYDLHGNVAEEMTRLDPDGRTYSQLKGSAFFYAEVARKHDERPSADATRETYPDHCAYDPRWHVEPIDEAWHVNYHLGFRCCKSVR
jgi:hypothetical protein